MFVRTQKKDENRWHISIVESVRDSTNGKQEITRSIDVAHSPEEVAHFTKIGERQSLTSRVRENLAIQSNDFRSLVANNELSWVYDIAHK
jgi:hypothetical protein